MARPGLKAPPGQLRWQLHGPLFATEQIGSQAGVSWPSRPPSIRRGQGVYVEYVAIWTSIAPPSTATPPSNCSGCSDWPISHHASTAAVTGSSKPSTLAVEDGRCRNDVRPQR